jgi:hypothetical protein
MSEVGEFEKQIKKKVQKVEIVSAHSLEQVISLADLQVILEKARQDFPLREETSIIGSDGEEHSYETYDTEAIDRWFCFWFGTPLKLG